MKCSVTYDSSCTFRTIETSILVFINLVHNPNSKKNLSKGIFWTKVASLISTLGS